MEKKQRRISLFLSTLRNMLDQNQSSEYIAWSEDQNSFIIKNPSRFSELVLPKYFKHSNLSSFIRQLNIYDFKKIINDKYLDAYIYQNQWFKKQKPELMQYIRRKVNKDVKKMSKMHQRENISNESQQKSITVQLKKNILNSILTLQNNLKHVQQKNKRICQQNIQLQYYLPYIRKHHIDYCKYFFHMLFDSYALQYLKFTQKIQQQLKEQQNLFRELHQTQQMTQQPKAFSIEQFMKKFIVDQKQKQKGNKIYSNPTSSGGSNNDLLQKKISRSFLNKQKSLFKEDQKQKSQQREQSNLDQYHKITLGQNHKRSHKKFYQAQQFKHEDSNKEQKDKRNSQQQNDQFVWIPIQQSLIRENGNHFKAYNVGFGESINNIENFRSRMSNSQNGQPKQRMIDESYSSANYKNY